MDNGIYEELQADFVGYGDQNAEQALKKLADFKREYERLDGVCRKQLDFYKAKQLEYKERYDNECKDLLYRLEQYFDEVSAKDKNITKTRAVYELPSGRLIKKMQKLEFNHNEEKLIETLRGTEFVEDKPNLKWGEYKKTLQIVGDKVVDRNGEIIEGVTVEVKPASFVVEV